MGIVLARVVPVCFLTRRAAMSVLLALGAGGVTGSIALGSAFAAERALVTFSGFQQNREGDSVVFVHLDRQPEVVVVQEGTRFTVRFVGAQISVRNNRHKLDLSHFGLLILSSQLVPLDNDVELRIELRKPARLATSWVERESGQVSLRVRIPAST